MVDGQVREPYAVLKEKTIRELEDSARLLPNDLLECLLKSVDIANLGRNNGKAQAPRRFRERLGRPIRIAVSGAIYHSHTRQTRHRLFQQLERLGISSKSKVENPVTLPPGLASD